MAVGQLRNVLGRIGRLWAGRQAEGLPDQQLMSRFVRDHEEAAFAAIMERHGSMVLGVCNRILRNAHDAEDACQAVFLVLARQATSVRKWGSLGSWLHGVARRVALKLQRSLARRTGREAAVAATRPTSSEPADLSLQDALRILDEELNRLPERYKAPLVLCHLEGRTQDEAAAELGWSLGALRGRLERARAKLRTRLMRRGMTASVAVAVAALTPGLCSAAVPAPLVVSTLNASVAVSAGQAIPISIASHVAALTQGVLQAQRLTKIMRVVASALTVTLLALGGIWFVHTREPKPAPAVTERNLAEHWSPSIRLSGHQLHGWCVAYSPDGKLVASGAGGIRPSRGQLKVWDAETGQELLAVETVQSARCVAFAPDGKHLATAEHDGIARLRDIETGDVVRTFEGHQSGIDAVSFSPDHMTLATSSWDNTVKLWDTTTGEEVQSITGHSGWVFGVAFGASEGSLASAGLDRTARIWDAATGKLRFTLSGHQNVVHWLAYSLDGRTLATASWDKTVRLWNTSTGRSIATLQGHPDPVLAVAFSPDGRTLASCSGAWSNGTVSPKTPSPGEVILWDLTDHKARARLRHKDRVFGVAFSPDGQTVATTCWNGDVTLWKVDSEGSGSDVGNDRELQFVLAAGQDREVTSTEHRKDYPENYHPSLKEKVAEVTGLLSYGPGASRHVTFDPDGLKVRLPADEYPKARPGTGVITDFGVKGDFEITVSFEVLREPEQAPVGQPTGLRLVVVPNESVAPEVWHKSDQNRASISREAASPTNATQFVATSTQWNEATQQDKWGNEIFTNKERLTNHQYPTEFRTGRLRLVRAGSTLYFYVSEGSSKEFTLVHKDEFGNKDLKNVRILGSTGGPGVTVEFRITDFQVRAEAFTKTVAATVPVIEKQRSWTLIVTIVLSVVACLGASLYVWQRRRTGLAMPVDAEPPPERITFACSQCGKRLKARPELAGRALRCPHCKKAVAIPKSEFVKPEESR